MALKGVKDKYKKMFNFDEAKEQFRIKQDELDTVNSLYNEVRGELDDLK